MPADPYSRPRIHHRRSHPRQGSSPQRAGWRCRHDPHRVAHRSSCIPAPGLPRWTYGYIHRILVAAPGAKLEASLPVRFDPYSKTLVIATKSSKPWPIKGAKQLDAVRYLFEQFENGRRWVPAGEILTAVYGTKESGRSRRMQNLFSGNTFWEDYIVNNDDSEYGFNLE